jgi:hypothetical protein
MQIIVFCCLAIFVCSCSVFKHYPQDNPIEESVEEILKNKTGLDVDFSLDSPESSSG